MVTIALFALVVTAAIATLTFVTMRRSATRTTTPEGLATEHTHTTDARAVGGIFGVHGAGTQATAALTTPESTRTFH
jgi:hypothetical protein